MKKEQKQLDDLELKWINAILRILDGIAWDFSQAKNESNERLWSVAA